MASNSEKITERFVIKKLVMGISLNTKEFEVDGMAVVDMVNQLRVKVI